MKRPPIPSSPVHPISPQATIFFVSPDEKSPQRETVAHVEEVKQKAADALNGIKIDEFKPCFEQWKKVPICGLHQMESALEVTAV